MHTRACTIRRSGFSHQRQCARQAWRLAAEEARVKRCTTKHTAVATWCSSHHANARSWPGGHVFEARSARFLQMCLGQEDRARDNKGTSAQCTLDFHSALLPLPGLAQQMSQRVFRTIVGQHQDARCITHPLPVAASCTLSLVCTSRHLHAVHCFLKGFLSGEQAGQRIAFARVGFWRMGRHTGMVQVAAACTVWDMRVGAMAAFAHNTHAQ